MKNSTTLSYWWCLERDLPFACLPLLANKVCLGKQLSRVERTPTLAPTCPGCNSNSDVYLQCDLWLINLHLLPGLINTYSAYLPDWRGELKGKPKLLTQHPVYKAMVSVAYKLPLSKANAGMTPSPTFLVKLWWVGFLGATLSLLLSILIYNFYMVKCTNIQYTTW